jgi:hypothetical protein
VSFIRARRERPIDLLIFKGEHMALMGALMQTASLLSHANGQKGEPVSEGRSFSIGDETLSIHSPKDVFDDVKVVFGWGDGGNGRIHVVFDDDSMRGRDDLANPMLEALESLISKLDEHSHKATRHQSETWGGIASSLLGTHATVGEFALAYPWSPFIATDDEGNDLRETLPAALIEEMDQVLPIAVAVEMERDHEGTTIRLTRVEIPWPERSKGDPVTGMRLAMKIERRREILSMGLGEPWRHPDWRLGS